MGWESLSSRRMSIEQRTWVAQAQLPPIIRHVWSCGHGSGRRKATRAAQALAPVRVRYTTGVVGSLLSRTITIRTSVVGWNRRLDCPLRSLAGRLLVGGAAHCWSCSRGVVYDCWRIFELALSLILSQCLYFLCFKLNNVLKLIKICSNLVYKIKWIKTYTTFL